MRHLWAKRDGEEAGDARARRLFERARGGDGEACAALWKEFSPRMMAYARAVLSGSWGVAQDEATRRDIVQAVFCAMLRDRAAKDVADPAAYLFRATRNAALNHARGRARADAREGAWAREVGRAWAASELAESELGEHEALVLALGRLDADARELMVLKHVAGLTFDQMGAALGLPRGTVASRYAAALRAVRMASGPVDSRPGSAQRNGSPQDGAPQDGSRVGGTIGGPGRSGIGVEGRAR